MHARGADSPQPSPSRLPDVAGAWVAGAAGPARARPSVGRRACLRGGSRSLVVPLVGLSRAPIS
eukprot:4899034-Alexandrium_andersonii.AAC.1